MPISIIDASGNIVTLTGAVGTPDQQVADSAGNLINPAKEDGALTLIKAKTDNLDVALSLVKAKTDNLDVALSLIKAKTDNLDVALSLVSRQAQLPAALSALGNLKAAVVEPIPAGTNLMGSAKIADSAGNLVDSALFVGVRGLQEISSPIQAMLVDQGKGFAFHTADVNAPSTGTEAMMLLFRNPVGSGKTAYLTKINMNSSGNKMRFYRAPTITTNGTAVTVTNRKFGDATAAVCLPTSAPTISNNGTQFSRIVTTGSGGSGQSNVPHVFDMTIIVPAGQTILVTQVPPANNNVGDIGFEWVEV